MLPAQKYSASASTGGAKAECLHCQYRQSWSAFACLCYTNLNIWLHSFIFICAHMVHTVYSFILCPSLWFMVCCCKFLLLMLNHTFSDIIHLVFIGSSFAIVGCLFQHNFNLGCYFSFFVVVIASTILVLQQPDF